MTGRQLSAASPPVPATQRAGSKRRKCGAPANPDAFTARLTIDITPGLRRRIKVTAFRRCVTVADMLRELLTREFPEDSGDAS
jgi:hypothetical protein